MGLVGPPSQRERAPSVVEDIELQFPCRLGCRDGGAPVGRTGEEYVLEVGLEMERYAFAGRVGRDDPYEPEHPPRQVHSPETQCF